MEVIWEKKAVVVVEDEEKEVHFSLFSSMTSMAVCTM